MAHKYLKHAFASVAVAGLLVVGAFFAQAESPSSQSAAPAAAEPVRISGYRSAQFGMDEDEVKKAIKNDFGVKNPDRGVNDLERTTVLVVPSQVLIPDSPPAVVSYILGAARSKLIQVNVGWGENGGAEIKQIVSVANALTSYFVSNGTYAKDSVVMNQQLQDGSILSFRGADTQGHMIVLMLVPIVDQADKDKAKDKPVQAKKALLRLSYIENPTKPDVFHLEKGSF